MSHLHHERDMEYGVQRAWCSVCGRTWRVWEAKNGYLIYLTEPRFPLVPKGEPRLRPKRVPRERPSD